jgi:hypothetical protein
MRPRFPGSLFAALVVPLLLAPQAEAKFLDQAKFKILLLSGAEALTFYEDGEGTFDPETGNYARCTGTTSSRISYRSTRPATAFVFLKRIHGAVRTNFSPDSDPRNFDTVPMKGEATLSRSVDYQETAGCDAPPSACPVTTVPAAPIVLGTSEPSAGVGSSVTDLPGDSDCEGLRPPFGQASRLSLPDPTIFARVIPRAQLFNEKRKRLEGSVFVEEQLIGTYDEPNDATASGTYSEEMAVTLKRLKFKE